MVISPRLMNYVMILYKWKRFIYHVGRARDQYSIAEIGLVAGGKEREEGRQTIFFTPLDPFNSGADEAESITDTTKPRKVQDQIHWRPEQDAVYWIHLSTAQDAGLEFWQTGSNAIITYQCVPKEYVVEVVGESGKRELFARQLTPRERPKVTLRPSWVHTRSNIASMPRETESDLQTWNSDPNASGSRTWAKEEIEQSIDLRVDGIPNDETYKDEQYMQRIAEQVQNIVTTKESLKDDSPEDNILSEQAVKKIHYAGNCELHEIQQRTNKVQCQRCYSYIETGFQVCPCGGQLNRQKFKQLVADAHMTYRGT